MPLSGISALKCRSGPGAANAATGGRDAPHVYIFVWLGFYGGLLGAVASVLIADYWLVRHTELRLADLYRRGGVYWYNGGWNWRAVVALGVGALLAVGGAWSAPGRSRRVA